MAHRPSKSLKSSDAEGRLADTVQVKLRIRREEHDWLLEEARKRGTTLNAMLAWRVMQNRDSDDLMTISRLVADASRYIEPSLISGFERDLYADALKSSQRLIDLVTPLIATRMIDGRFAEEIQKAIDDFHAHRRNLEKTVGEKIISKGTTGS